MPRDGKTINPFRQPTETEEDFEELVRLDQAEFQKTQENPFPLIECECGKEYTLEMHTVCPKCFRWPRNSAK